MNGIELNLFDRNSRNWKMFSRSPHSIDYAVREFEFSFPHLDRSLDQFLLMMMPTRLRVVVIAMSLKLDRLYGLGATACAYTFFLMLCVHLTFICDGKAERRLIIKLNERVTNSNCSHFFIHSFLHSSYYLYNSFCD